MSKIIAKPAGTLELLGSNTIIPSITEDGGRRHGGAVLGGFSRGRKGSEGISHAASGLDGAAQPNRAEVIKFWQKR